MEQELIDKFAAQDKKLDAIYKSAESTRKIFKWTLIITIITIVLPLIGLIFLIPMLLSSLPSSLNGINLSGTGLGF